MLIVLGLGNPGEKYENTPHNVGKKIIEKIIEKNNQFFGTRRYEKKINSDIYTGFLAGERISFRVSHEYMNLSGRSLSDEKCSDSEIYDYIVVIQDDMDLPFGKIKIVFDSGHGGHNGIRDIQKVLQTKKFIRIKFGVGIVDLLGRMRKPKGKEAVNNYLVHKNLSSRYQKIIEKRARDVEDILISISQDGMRKAMNTYNGKR